MPAAMGLEPGAGRESIRDVALSGTWHCPGRGTVWDMALPPRRLSRGSPRGAMRCGAVQALRATGLLYPKPVSGGREFPVGGGFEQAAMTNDTPTTSRGFLSPAGAKPAPAFALLSPPGAPRDGWWGAVPTLEWHRGLGRVGDSKRATLARPCSTTHQG